MRLEAWGWGGEEEDRKNSEKLMLGRAPAIIRAAPSSAVLTAADAPSLPSQDGRPGTNLGALKSPAWQLPLC